MCVGSVHARLLRVHQQQHQQKQTSYRRSIDSMGLINYKHTPKTQAYERGWRRQCPAHSPNNQQVGNLIRYVSRLVGLGPPRSQRGDRAYSIKAINKSYLALKQKSAAQNLKPPNFSSLPYLHVPSLIYNHRESCVPQSYHTFLCLDIRMLV